jgi:hypothetical protein
MIPENKDLKTWDEVSVWLARHGYGLAQIELIKAEWKAPVEEVVMNVVTTKIKTTETATPVKK